MDSSPSKINMKPSSSSSAGVKRPAPSLLPAFEPSSSSSSPALPRPSKRQARSSPSEREEAYRKYPSPIPTSTTGILSSSPPRISARPGLRRTQSIVSERAPLSAVRSVTIPENGEPLLMGRSSSSSHYQLSANRLISRIHVRVRYIAASVPLEPNKVDIICSGWNGLKLHCQGQTWELGKNDSFTSETENAEIMLDAQDARVLILWPQRDDKDSFGAQSDSSWDDEISPTRGRNSAVSARGQVIHASSLRRGQRLQSPESPTPTGPPASSASLSDLPENAGDTLIQVYEDEHSSENEPENALGISQVTTQAASSFAAGALESSQRGLSEPDEDPDEENDPVVHSFGPLGANISSRMASVTTYSSPEAARRPAKREPTTSPGNELNSEATSEADTTPITNHVINQLAFSRLSSTPLSVIMNNLPATLKDLSPTQTENKGLTAEDLQKLLSAASCIGEIHREGKDAAGKALESEYYYIPNEDRDEQRRAAVVDGLRKPSLRNCRKQHKQYYWKRPRAL